MAGSACVPTDGPALTVHGAVQVRVWNIPEQRVVDWADVHEMVTATAFSPDGRRAVVGTMKGRCRFYQCEPTFKLEYQAQIGASHHAIVPELWPVRAFLRRRRCMPHRRGDEECNRSAMFSHMWERRSMVLH